MWDLPLRCPTKPSFRRCSCSIMSVPHAPDVFLLHFGMSWHYTSPMSMRQRIMKLCAVVAFIALGSWPQATAQNIVGTRFLDVPADKLHPLVTRDLAEQGQSEVLVILREQADLTSANSLPTKEAKGCAVFNALHSVATRTQAPLLARLRQRGLPSRSFHIANVLWAKVDVAMALELAGRSDVALLDPNPHVNGLSAATPSISVVDKHRTRLADAFRELGSYGRLAAMILGIEPGLTSSNAPLVWAQGFTGQGIVVAGQDTGYQWNHPALITKYRGYSTSGIDHNYNWHDAIHSGGGSCGADVAAPCDDGFHGTHTMGTVCGDDGAGNQIGMAPGAMWIGARNMDQGNGTPATYLECFEWLLAPYPIGATPAQGDPLKAPHVTNNSWGCPSSEGCTITSLLLAVQAHRAAGIISVVSAGNGGSGCSTVADPPAIHDEVYSIGAWRPSTNAIASFSSRGPVTVDGSNRLKPDLVAPGYAVRSSTPTNTFGSASGTSMAGPHVCGAVALLLSAHPALIGQVTLVETILNDTALRYNSASCGSNGTWPNNLFGYGRLNVAAAVAATRHVLVASSSVPAPIGATTRIYVSVTNSGYLPDSFALSVQGSLWPASLAPGATLTPTVAPGATHLVGIDVTVPVTAAIGANDTVQLTATSTHFASATHTASTTITAAPLAPALSITQASPGAPVSASLTNLLAGHNYHVIFSAEPCPTGLGTGPYLGICTADINGIIAQLALPAGSVPFHIVATTNNMSLGSYGLPPGLTIEAVCFDYTNAALLGVSPVATVSTL